jgi:hypothetical protein
MGASNWTRTVWTEAHSPTCRLLLRLWPSQSDLSMLQSVSFEGCYIDDSILCHALKFRFETNESALPLLVTVIISECSGITRAFCEEMQALVSRVIVHIGLRHVYMPSIDILFECVQLPRQA